MKYMGSKSSLLRNGLGGTLKREATKHERFVDLFAGSAAVSWYVAEHTDLPVLSVDLQCYSVPLALAVTGRTEIVEAENLVESWIDVANRSRQMGHLWNDASINLAELNEQAVLNARDLCAQDGSGSIWSSYGGYYFSPRQALTFDHMLASLPEEDPERSVCLAATIMASARCVAAPGHTAQPFRPTDRALPHIADFWARDPLDDACFALDDLAPRHANAEGDARCDDAVSVTTELNDGDLVFVDPPYSAVHYSRFYHVYETIASQWEGEVSGAGRYPPTEVRPRSDFSLRSQAQDALEDLLEGLGNSGSTVVLTFPAGESSNGLSGDAVKEVAGDYFDIESATIEGKFSTLGGNGENRAARKDSAELVLVLTPKS